MKDQYTAVTGARQWAEVGHSVAAGRIHDL